MTPTKYKQADRGKARLRPGPWTAVALIAAVLAVLYFIFAAAATPKAPEGSGAPDTAAYAVGSPGPGEQAIGFELPSTAGGTVSLDDYAGQSTLFYFHEGIGCQPCWDQIRDLEAAEAQLKSAGIDELVTVTSGPVDVIARKMADDKLTSTALADTDLSVSRKYQMNKYGMMGDSRNGHSFMLVGPDGTIQWRADYGGAPNYTMYLPVATILADLESGRN